MTTRAAAYPRSDTRGPEVNRPVARIHITPIPTEHARSYWAGGLDAHGLEPERHSSDGTGVPCRHCLSDVVAGEPYLVLSYCPFPELQPYAEVGPIFLHATPCAAYEYGGTIPAIYLGGEPRILRGYDGNDRIIYGSGKIVPPQDIAAYAAELMDDPDVAYVHMRSSMNNCYSCRIERAAWKGKALA